MDHKKDNLNIFSEAQEVPAVLKPPHLPSLDGLRAISIIVVIFFHVLMSFKTRFSFHSVANLGVQFFFVISGFLITTLLIKERILKGDISLRSFYIRRFLRIIPVAFLYLLVVLILNAVLKLHLDLFLVLASFLFIRNFFINSSGVNHLTTHYWSLAIEEQFYLIFPFILKKNHRGYIFFLIGIISFSVLVDLLSYASNLNFDSHFCLVYLVGFLTQFQGIAVGSLAAIAVFNANISFNRMDKATLNIGLLLLIILLSLYQGPFSNVINILKCGLFAVILILNLNASNNLFFKMLNSGPMKLIGVLSYSLYIWQQPFTQGLTYANQSDLMKHFDHKGQIDIVITLASLILLGLVGYVSYYFYERKFLKLRDKFR